MPPMVSDPSINGPLHRPAAPNAQEPSDQGTRFKGMMREISMQPHADPDKVAQEKYQEQKKSCGGGIREARKHEPDKRANKRDSNRQAIHHDIVPHGLRICDDSYFTYSILNN